MKWSREKKNIEIKREGENERKKNGIKYEHIRYEAKKKLYTKHTHI